MTEWVKKEDVMAYINRYPNAPFILTEEVDNLNGVRVSDNLEEAMNIAKNANDALKFCEKRLAEERERDPDSISTVLFDYLVKNLKVITNTAGVEN